MASAQESVLRLPELLEQILLGLDMRDLLVSAQRVNRLWLQIIRNSTELQQLLFFEPVSPPVSLLGGYCRAPSSVADSRRMCRPDPTSLEKSLNPLLVNHFGVEFFNLHKHGRFHHWEDFADIMPWFTMERTDPNRQDECNRCQRAFMRSGASWRRMLLSQPPQPGLGYTWHTRVPRQWSTVHMGYIDAARCPAPGNNSPRKAGRGADGLRFGLLYDFVQHHVMQHNPEYRVWFGVAWGNSWESNVRSREPGNELLRDAGVVVQIAYNWRSVGNEVPGNVAAFHTMLRSEDFWLPEDSALIHGGHQGPD